MDIEKTFEDCVSILEAEEMHGMQDIYELVDFVGFDLTETAKRKIILRLTKMGF